MEASNRSKRQRTTTACNRCRTKKIKCNGVLPCDRCGSNSVCDYSKTQPKSHAEIIEDERNLYAAGLRVSYNWLRHGRRWPGEPVQMDENGDPRLHDVLEGLQIQRPNHLDIAEVDLSNSDLSTEPVHLPENAVRMPGISESGMLGMPAPGFNITRNLANLSESGMSGMLEYGSDLPQPGIDVFGFSRYADHGIQHQNPGGPNNVTGTEIYYYASEEFGFSGYEETSDRRWDI